MSNHYNGGSHQHQAAELHDQAAHAHLAASVAHEKQDHQSGREHSRQALEHSQKANNHTANSAIGHGDIAALAHQLWEARGYPIGSAEQDWTKATQLLLANGKAHPHG